MRGCSPSIATGSNNASDRTDARGDSGQCGCGVRNVGARPTWCGVGCRPPSTSVRSAPVAPIGYTLDQGIVDPGVCSRGLLLAFIGVHISTSPSGVGGGDRGLAGKPGCDPGGVSVSIPVLGDDVGCETYSSSCPKMDSSCSWFESLSSRGGGGDGDEPKKQGGAASPYISQVIRPPIAFYADVGGDL